MKATCTEAECDRPAFGRGLCARHYQYARKHGQLPTARDDRPCEHCGTMFSSRKWNARYCSERCNWNAITARRQQARNYLAEQCGQCGRDLPAGRQARVRFCSEKCGDDWRNAQLRATRLASKAALGRVCRGCGGPMDAALSTAALYCSQRCRVASRRHETYRLTKQELAALLAEHDRCDICQTQEWGPKGPQVDHDHATGRVRGVLCSSCNNGLGRFGDDPERLRAAARYLEQPALVTAQPPGP